MVISEQAVFEYAKLLTTMALNIGPIYYASTYAI